MQEQCIVTVHNTHLWKKQLLPAVTTINLKTPLKKSVTSAQNQWHLKSFVSWLSQVYEDNN